MTGMKERCDIVVLGVGNLLLTDDGVGVHAVRELARDHRPGVLVVDAGTSTLAAADLIRKARRVLVIDAVRAGGRPGSIYSLPAADVERPQAPASLHSLGLGAALDLVGGDSKATSIVVLGVEPERTTYGMELSDTVKSALPELLMHARDVVDSWLADAKNCEVQTAAAGRG